MTEAELKAEVVRLAHAAGWLVFSLPMVKNRRPVRNGSSGYPDLTLARDGRVIWLELKQDKGALFDAQVLWMMQLPEADYHVIRPADLVPHVIGRILA